MMLFSAIIQGEMQILQVWRNLCPNALWEISEFLQRDTLDTKFLIEI